MIPGFFAAGANGGGGGDPYWANVSALLHFDGVDGSTIFTDEKGKVWTPAGNAQIDTAQFKFGGASGLFDGTGDYIGASSHADFGFGAGDFTIEFWVRAASVTGDRCVFDNRSVADAGISIYSSISSGGGSNRWGIANNTTNIAHGGNLASNTWYHLAIARQGSTIRGFRDGSLEFTVTDSRTYASTPASWIGANYLGTAGYPGHIDDARITKGVARYTSAFTPPAGPFPNS